MKFAFRIPTFMIVAGLIGCASASDSTEGSGDDAPASEPTAESGEALACTDPWHYCGPTSWIGSCGNVPIATHVYMVLDSRHWGGSHLYKHYNAYTMGNFIFSTTNAC